MVIVETALPQYEDGWSWKNNDYAYIDLGVALPSNLPLEAIDSSGDAVFEDLNSLDLQDSSGDLNLAESRARSTSLTAPAISKSRMPAACGCATARAT